MGSARSRGNKCGLPFGLTPCAPKARKHPTPRRRPQSAKFIGTAFYEPEVMLKCASLTSRMVKSDFVGDTLSRLSDTWRERARCPCHHAGDTRSIHAGYETEIALRLAWPCKK